MIVLETYRSLEKLFGLHSNGEWKNIVLRIAILVALISFNSMEFFIVCMNIKNGIVKVAASLTPLCGIVPPTAWYGLLLIIRERYRSLLNEIQNIVDESK